MSEHHGQTWDRSREALYLRVERVEQTSQRQDRELDAVRGDLETTQADLRVERATRDARNGVWAAVFGFLSAIAGTVIAEALVNHFWK